MSRANLAERAGRWSAAHWKSAAFGWLGIALVAVVAGNLAGAVPIKPYAYANGDSRRAEEILTRDMNRAWYTSLPLTLAILGIAFGALVAAGLPVLLALSAVLAATGINALFSHVLATEPQTVGASASRGTGISRAGSSGSRPGRSGGTSRRRVRRRCRSRD